MNESERLLIEEAKEYVRSFLRKESSGHDYYHCLRVYREAMALAEEYHANDFIVGMTALLHDLDDYKISPDTTRAIDFLDKHSIKEKDDILYIIDNMSFTAYQSGKRLITLEGKIVQDADRLDALGAIGIARCFAFGGYKNRPIYKGSIEDNSGVAHFYQKLFQLPDLMNTAEAKELAEKRVEFMKEFLDEFYKEWED